MHQIETHWCGLCWGGGGLYSSSSGGDAAGFAGFPSLGHGCEAAAADLGPCLPCISCSVSSFWGICMHKTEMPNNK